MPHKDLEKRKEYMRNYMREYRKSFPKVKERERKGIKRLKEKKINLIEEAWGQHCYFCSRDLVRIIHRKDGQKHKLISDTGLKELEKVVLTEKMDYVRLCGICHRGVHWCMEYLGLEWEDIVEKLIRDESHTLHQDRLAERI